MTEDRERLRGRVLALTGMMLLLAGLLTALSLVVVVVVVLAIALVALLVAGLIWGLRGIDLRPAVRASSRGAVAASRAIRSHAPRPQVRRHARSLGTGARRTAKAAPHRTEELASRAFQGSISGAYRLGLLKLHSVDPHQRAQELNQLGAQLRRDGEPEQAAERHRAALEIVRDLGDQQAEAMTLNNLALALAHSGAEAAAVQHLEQAVDVLRELGDEEHEGQVIANLGIVYRRQGLGEEAATLFHEALQKLPPASPAYRQIEQELSRAS
ncbi:MAG TPA: tetratricopeptide repeat protein [Gaiellaceae bacterium]|nr:tetratricopeptide repeat protein [Gaiellaceae bacterium]HET8651532.1 tetratricopeptide repeat protein [Gaiellaceae bacterium]